MAVIASGVCVGVGHGLFLMDSNRNECHWDGTLSGLWNYRLHMLFMTRMSVCVCVCPLLLSAFLQHCCALSLIGKIAQDKAG